MPPRMNDAPAAAPASAAAGPAPALATCPGCGQGVDPLRAGHVAILDGRFRYFCRSDCKQLYLRAQGRPPEEDVATARPPEVAVGLAQAQPVSEARPRFPSRPQVVEREPREPAASRPTLPSP